MGALPRADPARANGETTCRCLTRNWQAELDAQFKNVIYYWTIHGWINLSLVPATALMEFYNAEMQPDDQNEAWQLIQGYPTKSVEASKGCGG